VSLGACVVANNPPGVPQCVMQAGMATWGKCERCWRPACLSTAAINTEVRMGFVLRPVAAAAMYRPWASVVGLKGRRWIAFNCYSSSCIVYRIQHSLLVCGSCTTSAGRPL
jgi:hypothetical protein